MARPWTRRRSASARILLFLAIPLLSLETGTEAIAQFPKDSDVRVGNELAAEQLGGGADPVQIVAAFDGAPDRAAVAAFARRAAADSPASPRSRRPSTPATAS